MRLQTERIRKRICILLAKRLCFAAMFASIARFSRIPVVPAAAPFRCMASAATASSAPFKILGIQQVAVGGLSKGGSCVYNLLMAHGGLMRANSSLPSPLRWLSHSFP